MGEGVLPECDAATSPSAEDAPMIPGSFPCPEGIPEKSVWNELQPLINTG